jgi:hypothetical protein
MRLHHCAFLSIAALLADEGRWITAQTIEVSGGFNL